MDGDRILIVVVVGCLIAAMIGLYFVFRENRIVGDIQAACEAEGGITFTSRHHRICVKGDKILWRKEL